VIHPGPGVQFASWAFTDRARASGLRWGTRPGLANALFEYLEIFCNRRRRHSSLGMLTPIEYELQLAAAEPVA
jgi:putative transposase